MQRCVLNAAVSKEETVAASVTDTATTAPEAGGDAPPLVRPLEPLLFRPLRINIGMPTTMAVRSMTHTASDTQRHGAITARSSSLGDLLGELCGDIRGCWSGVRSVADAIRPRARGPTTEN